jgi:hypothetical protein
MQNNHPKPLGRWFSCLKMKGGAGLGMINLEAHNNSLVTPQVFSRVFNPNEQVNRVDFGQTTVNLGHHLETSPTIPNDPPWSTLVNP